MSRSVRPVLAALAIALLSACQTTNYSKPSEKGRPPWVGLTEPADLAYFNGARPAPQPLPCGQVLYLDTAVSRKGVACTGYDFQALWAEAVAVRDARIASIQCGADCPRKDWWVFSRVRQCDPAVETAYLSMRTAVTCSPAEAAPPPQGLQPPPAGPWTGTGHETSTPPAREDWREEVRESGPRTLGCTDPPAVARFDAYFTDQSCDTITDFKPYVDAAELQASVYDSLLGCAPPCTKQPFSPDYVRWRCEHTKDVLVKVYWRPCR